MPGQNASNRKNIRIGTAIPLGPSATGAAGSSGKASDEKHQHPQMTTSKAFAQDNSTVVLLPAGTITSASAMTLGTALRVRPMGTCKAYISPGFGMPEGLYPVTFSDMLHCTFLGSPTLTPGVYTPETNVVKTLASVVIPGGSLGLHGSLMATYAYDLFNSATAKTLGGKLNTDYFSLFAQTTVNTYSTDCRIIKNCGSSNVQQVAPQGAMLGGFGGTTGIPQFLAQDTAVDFTVSFIAKLAAGATTDFIMFMGYSLEIVLSPQS